jgi:hypothetical protein
MKRAEANRSTHEGLPIEATDLLQERRSALISAAVTGKIDVRNYRAFTGRRVLRRRMSLHKEIRLEQEICEELGGRGWIYADGRLGGL